MSSVGWLLFAGGFVAYVASALRRGAPALAIQVGGAVLMVVGLLSAA